LSELANLHVSITAEDQTSAALKSVGENAQAVERDFKGAAMGASTLAVGAFSLYQNFDNLQKIQLRAQITQKGMTSAQASAQSAQMAYNAAVEKYGVDSEQAQVAAGRLKAAQEQLAISSQRAEIAQGDVNQSYMQFALMIVPQSMTMITGAQRMIEGLGLSSKLASVGINLSSMSLKGLGMTLLTPPLGVVIALAAVGIALWQLYEKWEPFRVAVNTLAATLRDVFVAAWQAVGEKIEWFRTKVWDPLVAGLQWTYTNVIEPIIAGLNRISLGGGGTFALPSYQTGGVIPATGPYLLHAGETVIPASSRVEEATVVGPIHIELNVNRVESPADEERLAVRVGREVFHALQLKRGARIS